MIDNVLFASSSFKELFSSLTINTLLKQGIEKSHYCGKSVVLSVGDGGSSTLESIALNFKHKIYTKKVIGAEHQPIKASYLSFLNKNINTAYIEFASAGGIELCKRKDALKATSYGVGELIKDAINKKHKQIILGLGDSATTDCGVGIMQALGVKFFDQNNKLIADHNSISIKKISRIDKNSLLSELKNNNVEIICFCDSSATMGGHDGCWMRAPQKGANKTEMEELKKGVNNFMNVVNKQYKIKLSHMLLSGSAGGTSGGLYSIFEAELVLGTHALLDLINFESMLKKIELIIVGEGIIDKVTLTNKAPKVIANKARDLGIPVIAICSSLEGVNIPKLNQEGINLVLRTNLQEYKNGLKTIKKLRLGEKIIKDTGYQIGNLIDLFNKAQNHSY